MILVDILFILILLVPILMILIPIVLIIYGIVKKKFKLITITAIITVIIYACCVLWNILFPTQFPYVDKWIYGKTEEEIIAVYGEPSYYNVSNIMYYVKDDDGVFGTGLMDSSNELYYHIYFDKDGKACKVEAKWTY